MPIVLNTQGIIDTAAYIGPGDLMPGALYWWGTRGYKNSSIGSNAIRLRRSSDNAEQDFQIIIDGGLNNASIVSFAGGSNLFATVLYDQTGNGFHQIQTTQSRQPPFIFGQLRNTAQGAIKSGFGLDDWMATNSGVAQVNQPFTLSMVTKFHNENPVTGATGVLTFGTSGNNHHLGYNSTGVIDPALTMTAGVVLTHTLRRAEWHGTHGVFNGASSALNVSGFHQTGNAGTNPIESGLDSVTIYHHVSVDAYLVEGGYWPSAFTETECNRLYDNQRFFWSI